MNLTELSLRRPITVLMVFASFLLVGAIAGRLVPLAFFPDLDFPGIYVNIPYPGSTPEEVEKLITRPAEEVLATISNVKRMRSDSHDYGTDIMLDFDWGQRTMLKGLEAKEKLDGIRHLLPSDVEHIYVRQFSATDMPVVIFRISSNRDLSNAYDMLNRNLKLRIARMNGVSKVDLYGVEKKEIRIELLLDRVMAHNVDLPRLVEELRHSNFLVSAGRINDRGRRYVVRPIGEFQTLEDIGAIIVPGTSIRLRDIANITYDHPELSYGRHLDRKYAVGLEVFKESGANTVEVSKRVIEEVEEIGTLPEMDGISIFHMDNLGEGIVSSINELMKAGLMGAGLAIGVLFFFLRRFATTLIVALAVPSSLVVTLGFLYFFDMSLNILSMMGLMLAVGMLVDNSVVVTENIHRRNELDGYSPRTIVTAVREVVLAVTAGTFTTAIVFLPNIIAAKDEVSTYIKYVAMSIVIALATSLIIAQTVVPLLAARIKPREETKKQTVIDRLQKKYTMVLGWTLRHHRTSIAMVVLILISVAVPISIVKKDMFEEPDSKRLYMRYYVNGNYTVDKVEATVDRVEDYLFAHQDEFEINSVYSYYEGAFAASTILLKEEKLSRPISEIMDDIEEGLPQLPIADPSFERRRSGAGESARIQLIGRSSEQLATLSREVARVLEEIDGLSDVRSDAEAGEKEVRVVIDRDRARQYGFTIQEIARTVAAAMRGMNLPRFRDDKGEIELKLQFQREDQKTLEELQNLPLFNGGDQPIKLAAVADFRVSRGPRRVHREDRITSIGVSANLDGITMSAARDQIREVLGLYNFPPGYTWSFGRAFSYEDEASRTMMTNTLLALALIYFVMAALFESLIFPAAIWTSIIFAIVGVWWFFLVTGTTFSIMAWIGVLILMGVVVNNGIVLIDHVNQLRAKGLTRREAIIQGGHDRLRPILMTAATTVLGLVPLTFTNTLIGGNGPPYYPMARAIVGGLIFSTAVTLLILPTIYVILDDMRNWSRRVVQAARRDH
ncbi:MAG: efflux RND transporter permease subunit [Fidelibacterota bacterium]|nr:MAG: efflux RND transporter permease subunit [Candidatus Neomarinimicrobiota bacterium]